MAVRLPLYLLTVLSIGFVSIRSFDRVAHILATNLGAAIGQVEVDDVPAVARPWRVAAAEAIHDPGDPPSEHLRAARPSTTEREQVNAAGRDADVNSLQRIGWRDADESTDGDVEHMPAAGTYRTVCVRLCDGYFFPVSFATTREHFARDEARCKSSCTSPARLYVSRGHDGGTQQMRDLKGRPYAALAGVAGAKPKGPNTCGCRAEPWEEASIKQHQLYAALQSPAPTVERVIATAPGTRVAGSVATGPAGAPVSISLTTVEDQARETHHLGTADGGGRTAEIVAAATRKAAREVKVANSSKQNRRKAGAAGRNKGPLVLADKGQPSASGWTALMGLGAGTLKSKDVAYLRSSHPTTASEDFRRTFFSAF